MSTQINSGQSYTIVNIKSGTVMDLSAGNNLNVTGWPLNGGSNQKWTMNWAGNGWTFQNEYSNTYLGILGNSSHLGDGNLTIAVADPFVWDIWRDEVNPNTFRIFVPYTNKNLDLSDNGIPVAGDPIQIWATFSGLHQTWDFIQV